MTDLAALLDRLPDGWSRVTFDGRTYGVTRTRAVDGHAISLYAEELGGTDVVSANVYRTAEEDLLRPCEMPGAKVIAFLRGLEPA
ncbi:peptide methionine sulfoxide reductase [Nocardioides guangzhouensis]|uniref:peptide methionine sulfoxide reductase n=1 Tax=Nocardioides guangzhouensis TaxID=2497878 RepID=UPI001FE9CFE2|nr:peptide methionine sulfoxide reductase [Nocardioides guangzhouensis]